MKHLIQTAAVAAFTVLVLSALQPPAPSLAPAIAFAQQDLTAFSQEWAEITPSDSTALTRQPRALYICDPDGGDLDMVPWRAPNAEALTFPVSGAAIYPLSPSKVLESSTVDCIIALY